MAKEPEKEDPEATEQPSGRGAKTAALGAVLLLGLVIGSASAAVVVASIALRPSRGAPAKDAATTREAAETEQDNAGNESVDFTLVGDDGKPEALIVNVRNTQQRRYLSARPVFVLANEEVKKKVEERNVELRHALITILKTKTLEQLDDPQIGNTLGREIREIANAKLGLENGITHVYFTQLVVQ